MNLIRVTNESKKDVVLVIYRQIDKSNYLKDITYYKMANILKPAYG